MPGDGVGTLTLDLDGQPRADEDNPRETRVASVGPGFFETFGVSAATGRVIESADGTTGREVVVVNRRFVERFLGGGDLVAEASSEGWTLARLERRYVEEVLRRTGGNHTRAAAVLGISRKALIDKKKRWSG